MRRAVGASILILASALAMAAAQQPEKPRALAMLRVAVTDRSGVRPVTGLTAADFRIVEDGKEQPVAFVSEGPGPISVAVVVDTSDGMAGVRRQLAQHAVERLVASLAPEDEIALVTYERAVRIAVPWTRAPEFPKLDWALWKTMPFSELLQGIYQAIGLMNQASHARTAVVAVSDAQQIASEYGLKDFVKNRRESETVIYGLRTADLLSAPAAIGGPRPGAPNSTVTIWDSRGALVSFDDLVRDSGGLVLPVRTTDEGSGSVARLLSDLRTQYTVTFTPLRPPDGTYRRLKVELRTGKHKLRHATGYLAAELPASVDDLVADLQHLEVGNVERPDGLESPLEHRIAFQAIGR